MANVETGGNSSCLRSGRPMILACLHYGPCDSKTMVPLSTRELECEAFSKIVSGQKIIGYDVVLNSHHDRHLCLLDFFL
ncbi:hypothetical protein TNIN_63781 [Trichonephila inaurata madagascariensis]|uniref:Uncharacterized protein n=1 Tax=Trichonephila inaurata madagascariensis TaxID=2747483 RepID=A0A8X6XIJ2_9ARAC|nr:hypothetical protein TNIN_63781 [Trichonephila inaurata madagascariensis]